MVVVVVYFAVIVLAFFALFVLPQRRRLTAHRAFVAALAVGDEVVTTGGIFGMITGLDEYRVQLEVAPGVTIEVARAAIAQSATPAPPVGADSAPPALEAGDDDEQSDA